MRDIERMRLLYKDASITAIAQEYTVSYGAYLLEEASYHSVDCNVEGRFAFKLHVQNPDAILKFSLGLEPVVFSPYRSI